MGISTIWIYGEATNGVVSTTTLELITGARQLADTVEVIVHGDASSLASQLGEYGAASVKSIAEPVLKSIVAVPPLIVTERSTPSDPSKLKY